MSILKLKSIKLRNFGTVHESEIAFPDKGLVLVLGKNTADSNGKFSSIGSGKTLLGEAISRALVAVDGRFSNFGHYSSDNKGNKDTFVQLDTLLNGKPLTVEMGYKCSELSKTGEGLRFTYSGNQTSRAHLNDTREELQRTVKITPRLAEWTVFIDGGKLQFNKLSEKEAVELLMDALSQPPWTQYHANANKILLNFKRQLSTATSSHSEAKSGVKAAEDELKEAEEDLKGEKAAFDAENQALEEQVAKLQKKIRAKNGEEDKLRDEVKKLTKEIKEIENSGAEEFAKLDRKRLSLKSKLNEAQAEKERRIESRSKAKSAFDSANERLSEMKAVPKNCPSCDRPWDKVHGKEELEKQTQLVADKKDKYDAAKAKVGETTSEIEQFSTQISDIEEQLKAQDVKTQVERRSRKIETLQETLEDVSDEARSLEKELESTKKGPSRTALDKASAVVDERKRLVAKAKEKVESTAQALAESEEAVKVISYWTEAYSPTGIPNMILQDTIAPLNDISKRLSLLMTGGTIEITYATKRELASGKDKAELVINIKNRLGSKRVEGSSKGEAGLTNLIVAETLSEVGGVSNRIGYRWYDEVVNNQDPVVRQNIFTYLRETANRLGILIFVVDHHQEASNFADHILVAEKTAQRGTVFRWS